MTFLEYLKSLSKFPSDDKERMDRIMKALEIIAEELIKHNEHERIKFDYLKLKGIKVNT